MSDIQITKSKARSIRSLLGEHEVIRTYIKNVERLMDSIYHEVDSEAIRTAEDLHKIRNNMLNLSAVLYNLKDGTAAHEQRDKHVFEEIIGQDSDDYTIMHMEIAKSLDNAIMQLDLAMSEQWTASELKQCLKNIRNHVNSYHEMVITHTQHEDELMAGILSKIEL